MRRTLQCLVLAAAATATPLIGAAAPAQASVVRCGPAHILGRDTAFLPVLVSTCGETDGVRKRGNTTLVNLSNQPVPIQDLRRVGRPRPARCTRTPPHVSPRCVPR